MSACRDYRDSRLFRANCDSDFTPLSGDRVAPASIGSHKSGADKPLDRMPAARESARMSPTSDNRPAVPRLRLRILFGEDAMLGPGKAELLERVRDTGSIAAAGRAMRMSYKRAWMLVEEMNAAFAVPLVDSARGGAGGGGAQLTETGAEVLRLYRAVERAAADSACDEIAALQALLKP